MALPATDAFTGSNNTQLTTYSGNWTLNSGDFDIQSNQLSPDSVGNENGAHWNADAFNNDQYSQGVITTNTSAGDAMGVACRAHASAATYYGFYVATRNTTTGYLFKMVSGTWTQFGADITSPANGSLIKITAVGTTITAYDDGASVRTGTDSAIASGSAGVTGYDDSATDQLDSWEGGNTSSGTTVTPGTLALTTTKYAPTVQTPRLVTPSTKALTTTPYAPSIVLGTVATPGMLALTTTGYAPTIVTPVLVTPDTAALTITPYAPQANLGVVPDTAALTLTGYAPTVTVAPAGGGGDSPVTTAIFSTSGR